MWREASPGGACPCRPPRPSQRAWRNACAASSALGVRGARSAGSSFTSWSTCLRGVGGWKVGCMRVQPAAQRLCRGHVNAAGDGMRAGARASARLVVRRCLVGRVVRRRPPAAAAAAGLGGGRGAGCCMLDGWVDGWVGGWVGGWASQERVLGAALGDARGGRERLRRLQVGWKAAPQLTWHAPHAARLIVHVCEMAAGSEGRGPPPWGLGGACRGGGMGTAARPCARPTSHPPP